MLVNGFKREYQLKDASQATYLIDFTIKVGDLFPSLFPYIALDTSLPAPHTSFPPPRKYF